MATQEQKALVLAALSAAPLDRIRLMKTLFLAWYRHGEDQDASFTFEAYNYGAISWDVYTTLTELQNEGLIQQPVGYDPQTAPYYVTKAGQLASGVELPEGTTQEVSEIAKWANQQSFNSLLRSVYKEAPKYAEKSLVRDEMLR